MKRHENQLDISGKRFACMIVKNCFRDHRGKLHWNCQCDCGTLFSIDHYGIVNGHTKRCKPCDDKVRGLRMMDKNYISMIGFRRDRLVVEKESYYYGGIRYECLCDCGKTKTVLRIHLLSNKKNTIVKSCGCLPKETAKVNGIKAHEALITHGMASTPEYRCWSSLNNRCFNTKDKSYPNYGGRGITVCAKWETFEGFFEDMGKRPKRHYSLERLDVNGPYSKENCVWASPREQGRNKRNTLKVMFRGELVKVLELCERFNKPYARVRDRLVNRGWDIEKAIFAPSSREPEDEDLPSVASPGNTIPDSLIQWCRRLGRTRFDLLGPPISLHLRLGL
jgi:hypothetical protein